MRAWMGGNIIILSGADLPTATRNSMLQLGHADAHGGMARAFM